MWCWRTCSPRRAVLELGEVADLRRARRRARPGRRWLNGPIVTSSSTADARRRSPRSTQSAPIVRVDDLRAGRRSGSARRPSSRRGGSRSARGRRPRRARPPWSRYTVDGSSIVTPARIQRSLSSTRMSHSARASWARSLMPVSRPSSSTSSAATSRPSSRANATRSVRYSSPVVGRRLEVADPAPQPRGVERVQARR